MNEIGNFYYSGRGGLPQDDHTAFLWYQKGAQLNEGDLVTTNEGRSQLRFIDGAQMSLPPRTEFRIEEYKFEGKTDGSERAVLNLVRGGMRTVTGSIGPCPLT